MSTLEPIRIRISNGNSTSRDRVLFFFGRPSLNVELEWKESRIDLINLKSVDKMMVASNIDYYFW